jgi:hypothetical protein
MQINLRWLNLYQLALAQSAVPSGVNGDPGTSNIQDSVEYAASAGVPL